ncbi:hypothetical protein [Streptomyces sp. PKU-EA00015]|uniref:hypothetical protein n=1 Tax=Streptomyces sp. PKU-EA00015 TaxID=2748326 RepID=UPI0028124719|nr:hypothetical protein [Streptomyces sp. PKU-EA00015]
MADQLAEANWMFATVNRDEESEPLEYPKPLPRPGLTEPPDDDPARAHSEAGASPAEIARFFA